MAAGRAGEGHFSHTLRSACSGDGQATSRRPLETTGHATDTSQKTESLSQLVADIDKGAVALAEFQRDFVWEVEKTYDLFDSFVKDVQRVARRPSHAR